MTGAFHNTRLQELLNSSGKSIRASVSIPRITEIELPAEMDLRTQTLLGNI